MSITSGRFCGCLLLLTVLSGSVASADPPITDIGDDAPAYEVTDVKLTHTGKESFQVLLTLAKERSEALTQSTVRLLFVKADAKLSPKTVTDIDADGSMEMRDVYPWSQSGGSLTKGDQDVGFVLDLSDQRGWTGPKHNQIVIPLTDANLLSGMGHRLETEKGELFVAFVKAEKDGVTMVPTSNTVHTAVVPHK